ncbi:MAG: hypothetical protein QXR30_02020 [Candidatus Woesearchaeota archaeon]
MFFKKRVKSHHFEKIVFFLILLAGFASLYVFMKGMSGLFEYSFIVLLQMNLVIIVLLLIIAYMVIKIYEKVE